ncbi:MAG: nucleotidyltransferase domain-containing protein [Methanothrix sp.]
MITLEEIRRYLHFLKDHEVVAYGSYVTGEFREGSDTDVAVITRSRDTERNLDLLRSLIGMARPLYYIRIFERLPLRVKASVMSDYVVVYGDELEISEYFYTYRKLWDDQKQRILGGYFESWKESIDTAVLDNLP